MEALVDELWAAWTAMTPVWSIFTSIPWVTLFDVGLMACIVYQIYMRFRGTPAIRVVGGIVVLVLAGLAARRAGLFLTAWFLSGIGAAAFIFVLIIFQAEIRQVLEQLNPQLPARKFLSRVRKIRRPEEHLVPLAESVFALAAKRCGALLVFERHERLEPLMSSPGTVVNAEVSPELLETLFTPPTPLHDGALYIRNGKIYRAGCVLPLSKNPRLASFYGTRHRAALGMTEHSDALAVVVSEERGTVSVAEQGTFEVLPTPQSLVTWLTKRLTASHPTGEQAKRHWFSWFNLTPLTLNWRPKLAALAAMALLWFVLVGRQNTEVGFSIPVVYTNVPPTLTLQDQAAKQVYVNVRGSEEMLNFVDPNRIRVTVDLTGASAGRRKHTIAPENINLPPGLQVIGINPAKIEFRLGEKPEEAKPKS